MEDCCNLSAFVMDEMPYIAVVRECCIQVQMTIFASVEPFSSASFKFSRDIRCQSAHEYDKHFSCNGAFDNHVCQRESRWRYVRNKRPIAHTGT